MLQQVGQAASGQGAVLLGVVRELALLTARGNCEPSSRGGSRGRALRERGAGARTASILRKSRSEKSSTVSMDVWWRRRARWAADSAVCLPATVDELVVSPKTLRENHRPRPEKVLGLRKRSSRKLWFRSCPVARAVGPRRARHDPRRRRRRISPPAPFRAARTARRDGPDDALRAPRAGDDLPPRRAPAVPPRARSARATTSSWRSPRTRPRRSTPSGAPRWTRCTTKAATTRRLG